jgi:hypothetical protein
VNAWLVFGVSAAWSEESAASRENLSEPVLRVANTIAPRPLAIAKELAKKSAEELAKNAAHPLDPALDVARDGLKSIRGSINDYTCTLVKRERIDGELTDYEYMSVKVRNHKEVDGKVVTPFSVYMYFLKPAGVKGREVIYIEGRNENKLVAHEGGLTGKYLPTVWLAPTGVIAMRGQKYPITDLGIENLVLKLIERGERDKEAGNKTVEVSFHPDAKINGRKCTLLQVKNHEPSPNLDFHLAQIFIDDELNVPVRYAAYDFPPKAGDPMPVIEEYTYLNVKLNVGLTDKDFDHENKEYSF